MEKTENEFLSNCLWEAIKAKLKDWKNVKIIKLEKDINLVGGHYMWYDYKAGVVKHFKCEEGKAPLIPISFRGVIKETPIDLFNNYMVKQTITAVNRFRQNLKDKYAIDMELYDWFEPEGCFAHLPSVEEAKRAGAVNGNLLKVLLKDKSIRFVNLEDGLPEETDMWRYVNITCEEYYLIK